VSTSEAKTETTGGKEIDFIGEVQAQVRNLERELYDLKHKLASFILDMGSDTVRTFEGETLRLIRDAAVRTLACASEPLTIGQIHEKFEAHTQVYGVTRKELHRVVTGMSQGSRSKIRRFKKSATSKVVLYELRAKPRGIWHQGRYWTAGELAKDQVLNKHQLSERTILDRMKSREFIHQILDRPSVSRGPGARSRQPGFKEVGEALDAKPESCIRRQKR